MLGNILKNYLVIRNNGYTFVRMKTKEIRKLRGYKATDKDYDKAQKRAAKTETPLAKIIENVVKAYAKGNSIFAGDGNDIDDKMVYLND